MGHVNLLRLQVLLTLLEQLTVPGAREVLLADRRELGGWAERNLGWPPSVDVWARVGHQLGRRGARFPLTCASWKERARPGRRRRSIARREGTPLVVLASPDPGREGLRGRFASGEASIPVNEEVFSLANLRNLNPEGRVPECWIFDEASMELIGGWVGGFVGTRQANRWRQKCRVLLATQIPVSRGPRKEHRPGGRMVGSGTAVGRASRELREYLAAPKLRREPEGLTLKANLSARFDLLHEFLDSVRMVDDRLVDELAAMPAESPELPPPMWVTRDYQVSAGRTDQAGDRRTKPNPNPPNPSNHHRSPECT